MRATCTTVLIPAVGVRVTDARTGAGICDAMVEVSEGTFRETLEVSDRDPASCEYFGAGERAGT